MKKTLENKPFKLGRNTAITVSLGVVVSLVGFLFGLGVKYNTLVSEINTLKEWKNTGERFTAKDGNILKEDIEELKRSKADRSDIKIVEIKLANIETILLELKQKIK